VRFGTQVLWLLLALLVSPPSLTANDVDKELAKKLDGIRIRFGLRRAIGVVVKDMTTGATIYEHNPDKKFVPASGMKLTIIGASLHYLGPNYRFRTEFLVDGPLEDGVVKGNLYVHGSGDPSLTSDEMDYIARSLAERGLRAIEGNIILDDSFFDDRLRGPASYDNILKEGLPIQSALSYNFNRVEIKAMPGAAGSRAQIHDGGYGYAPSKKYLPGRYRGRPQTGAQRNQTRARVARLPRLARPPTALYVYGVSTGRRANALPL